MKLKNDACDQYASTLMGEIQRMEAKKVNLDSILKRCEDDVSSKKTRINFEQYFSTHKAWTINVLEDTISFAGTGSPRNNHKFQHQVKVEVSY